MEVDRGSERRMRLILGLVLLVSLAPQSLAGPHRGHRSHQGPSHTLHLDKGILRHHFEKLIQQTRADAADPPAPSECPDPGHTYTLDYNNLPTEIIDALENVNNICTEAASYMNAQSVMFHIVYGDMMLYSEGFGSVSQQNPKRPDASTIYR